MDNWVSVAQLTDSIKSEILKSMLETEGIKCVIVNKQDSAYPTIGHIQLFVEKDNVIQAKHLLSKQLK